MDSNQYNHDGYPGGRIAPLMTQRQSAASPRPSGTFLLRVGAGLLLLTLVILWIDPAEILAQIQQMAWYGLPALMLLFFFTLLTSSLGLFALFRPLLPIPLKQFMHYAFFSLSLAGFLPFQLGESSLLLWLKQEGMPLSRSLSLFLTDKLITLLALGSLGSLAIYLLLEPQPLWLGMALGVPLLALGLGAILLRLPGGERWAPVMQRRLLRHLGNMVDTFLDQLRHNRHGVLANLLLTTLRVLLIYPLMHYTLLYALGDPLPFWTVLLVGSLLALVSVIPLTVQGLGVMEVSSIYLFSLVGVEDAVVVAMTLILRLALFLFNGLILAIIGPPSIKRG